MYECKGHAIRTFATVICSGKVRWFIARANSCSGKRDQIVKMMMTRHAAKAEFTRKVLRAASVDLCSAGAGMRLAGIQTQTEFNSHTDGFIVSI